jgi:uncharacterized phage protein (TIGR02218 family)
MTRIWFSNELETVATWWRIERMDGVALGFTSHDRNVAFGGITYRTAPGMVPSAIRLTSALDSDSAEITGALSHDSIRDEDLIAGRFDAARILVGLVDWDSGEHTTLYAGTIGAVASEGAGFSADLLSLKHALKADMVPRTSPTCRAEFCGAGCTLSVASYSHEGQLAAVDGDGVGIHVITSIPPENLAYGTLRWLDGPECGLTRRIEQVDGDLLILDHPTSTSLPPGTRVRLREGCDHTLRTCTDRFANAVNFQGEPFVPGNDLLTSYPAPQG